MKSCELRGLVYIMCLDRIHAPLTMYPIVSNFWQELIDGKIIQEAITAFLKFESIIFVFLFNIKIVHI